MNWLQRWWLCKFSKPAGDRALWKHLLSQRVGSVLLIELAGQQQLDRLLQTLRLQSASTAIRLAAIDRFESVPGGLLLKNVHRSCAEAGLKTHLLPGEISTTLPRAAMTLAASDLIVVNSATGLLDDPVSAQWLARLVHSDSHVLVRDTTGQLTATSLQPTSQQKAA